MLLCVELNLKWWDNNFTKTNKFLMKNHFNYHSTYSKIAVKIYFPNTLPSTEKSTNYHHL